jgi:uncharacterized repeat protein (TIGR01451 family)/LPXTG-motif cell wall-anchored protein
MENIINSRRKLFSVFIVLVLLIGITPVAFANTGAIWTTDSDGDSVNDNQYDLRTDLYLNGGPKGEGGGLPDGNYWVRVTDTSGKTVLGISEDAVIEVNEDGKFSENYQLWDIVYSASSGFTEKGYDFTPNKGGEYKVWVSQNDKFPNNESKTDNFSVYEEPAQEPDPDPSITVAKSVDPNEAKVGDQVTYTYVVTNTGNVTLTRINLTDDKLGDIDLDEGETTLEPGESFTKTVLWTVALGPAPMVLQENNKPDDTITNTATVTGYYGKISVSHQDTAELRIIDESEEPDPDPSITVAKSVDPNEAKVGDQVTYTYVVTNTGNVTLTRINLTDDKLGDIDLEEGETTLEPGESFTKTVLWTVALGPVPMVLQENNEPDDTITNTATVTGYYGEISVSHQDTAELRIIEESGEPQEPWLKLTKTVSPTRIRVGGTVKYTYTIKNNNDVEITGLTLFDDKLGEIELDTTVIAPGEIVTAEVEYKTKSVGVLKNTAIVEGWYGEVKVTDEASVSITVISRGGGSSGGSDGNDKESKGEDSTEEPITVPEEPVVGEPSVTEPEPEDQEIIQVPDEQIPTAPPLHKELPKTGGNPISLIISGVCLAGLGILLKRRA